MSVVTRIVCVAVLAAAAPSFANSFTNGGFEATTGSATNGQINFNVQATGWTVPVSGSNKGYVMLFGAGTADGSGVTNQYGNIKLWGPGTGSANGLPASSPSGGNYIGMDGNFSGHMQPLQQVITGLTSGMTYTVGFDYGFGQQSGFDGVTVQDWTVSFAGQSQSIGHTTVANHGFTGWQHATMSFIAHNATETLSFLAYGNLPVPPFALLDGVSFSQEAAVPEPASWALMLVGFGGMGIAIRRRRAHGIATA